MASENAKAVAREIIEKVKKGERVHKGEIIAKHGYTKSMALHPQKITETKSFKEEMEPFLAQLKRERQRLMKAIELKDLDAVSYKDAVDAADKLTKNIQLLSGGNTANDKISFSWEE